MTSFITARRTGPALISRTWHRLAGPGRWARALRRVGRHALSLALRGATGASPGRHAACTAGSSACRCPACQACATEGAALEFGAIEIDGRHWGALYRGGELVCLLEEIRRL